MRSTVFRVAACLMVLFVVGTPASALQAGPPSSVTLAIDSAFADPSFVTDGGVHYAYATGGGRQGAFPHATANSMGGPWTKRGMAMPVLPHWAGPTPEGRYEFWAPSVFGSTMYFTANNKTTNDRCVGVAEATSPAGPFTPRPEPLLCQSGAQVIDASSFVDADQQRYVLYKVRQGSRFEIRANRTDAGGTVLTSPARTLVAADSNIEAPDVIASGGQVFLFVSRGNHTDCTYRTEVWRAGSLWDGTWRNIGTLMDTAGTGLCGPGGAEVRRVGAKTWMVFHGWKCAPNCYRAMYTGLIGWGADGRTPRVL